MPDEQAAFRSRQPQIIRAMIPRTAPLRSRGEEQPIVLSRTSVHEAVS